MMCGTGAGARTMKGEKEHTGRVSGIAISQFTITIICMYLRGIR